MAAQQPSSARRVVAEYPDYEQAQHAVDYLSDQGFEVRHVSIVGEGLRFVEQVTGRRGYSQAAGRGAGNGAVVGAFLGFVFGLFSFFDPLVSALYLALWGLLIGAVVGGLIGLVGQAATRGRRDFSSVGGMQATRYQVQVDEPFADEAQRVLGASPVGR